MKISVVIPAYNEAELLPRALAALLPQAQEHGAEIIVIDNNSSDATAEIARRAGARVVGERQPGVVYALQRGLNEARGNVVAFTDADTIVGAAWLQAIDLAMANPDVVASTGPVQFDQWRWLAWWRLFARRSLVGSNMAIRRLAALKAGGFDPRFNLGSDVAMGWRLRPFGQIVYRPNQTVTTSARRFRSNAVWEGLQFVGNHLWMVTFRKPLLWHFRPIRHSAAEVDRRARRQGLSWSTGLVVLWLVYLSAWPTSTVFGEITTQVKSKDKVVALTFDDGPNGSATRTIVDILKAKNVPATFFEVGRSIAADPSTTQYVSQAGFPIENHSWDHSFRLPYMTPGHIHQELADTNQIITATTGRRPTIFRPPHGLRSPQMIYEVERLHLRLVNWNIDPQDYNTGDPHLIIKRVLGHVHPGSILLLHDGIQDGPHAEELHDRLGDIIALPEIIDRLRADGYTFVSLEEIVRPERDDRSATST